LGKKQPLWGRGKKQPPHPFSKLKEWGEEAAHPLTLKGIRRRDEKDNSLTIKIKTFLDLFK
jgi:hypothetical protein